MNSLKDEYLKLIQDKYSRGGALIGDGSGASFGKSLYLGQMSELDRLKSELSDLKFQFQLKSNEFKKLKEEFDDNILLMSIKDMEDEIQKSRLSNPELSEKSGKITHQRLPDSVFRIVVLLQVISNLF